MRRPRRATLAFAICAALAPGARAGNAPSPDPTAAAVERWLAPGRSAAAAGDYARAREVTRAALADAERRLPRDHWGRAYLLNDLARWEAAGGDRARAAAHAGDALAIARVAFADDAARTAYFALDAAVLRFQGGDCRGAADTLAPLVTRLPPSRLRERLGLEYARVLWATGDLAAARRAATGAAPPEASADGLLLVAQLDVDDGRSAAARAKLDRYRAQQGLGADERTWPAPYLEAELAYALATADLRAAEARSRVLLAQTEQSTDAVARAAAHHRLGQALSLAGRFAAAEAELLQAADALADPSGSASPARANVLHDLAWLYRQMRDYPRSEFYFERALAGARSCASDADAMSALMIRERALLRIEQGKVSEALADADDAGRRAAALPGDTRVLRGLILATRAFALDRIGDAHGSQQAMTTALQLIRDAEGAGSSNLPLGQVHLADLAYRAQRFPAARQQADAALAILDSHAMQSVWGTGAALSVRGASYARERMDARYWSDVARFVDVVESALAPGSAASTTQSEIALARAQAERLLDAVPASVVARMEQFGRLMQLPHVSDATASVQAAALEGGALPAAARARLRERAELLERAQALRSSLLLAQNRGQSPDESSVAALTRVLRELASTDAALREASPAVAGQLLQRTIPLADVQRLLGDREAVLLQVITDERAHALLLTRDAAIHRSAPVSRVQLRTHVRTLRRALDLSLPSSDRIAFDARSAEALYRASVGLFERELAGRDSLVVIADDAYQSLPWSVLVDRVDAAGDAAGFVVDRIAISALPSLQSLVALRGVARGPGAERPLAAFGDPRMESFRTPAGNAARGGSEAERLDVIRGLPPLPETAAEIERIATALRADARDTYVGTRATEAAVRDAGLSRFRIVSFATHGLMAGEIPGLAEPALVLTRGGRQGEADDGLLTASEIARLSLRADLVILSACNTGRINAKAGITGLSGLARAFFAAGARSLVVSHWAVASDATARLLSRTVERLAADPARSPADALRESMLWMRRGGAGVAYGKPEFWGAFSAVGGAGEFAAQARTRAGGLGSGDGS